MYNVSEAFKTASERQSHSYKLIGTIGSNSFDERNIVQGSFSLSGQCCSSTDIEIGQVYVTELDCTFINTNITRTSHKGLEIIPQVGLKMADNSYEYLPIGIFTIDSATWTSDGIKIVAYDNMAKFEKKFNSASVTTQALLYDFLTLACTVCNVELGMTKEEVEALPNANHNIGLYSMTTDIETWRDYISWLAQATASNALISRDGKLYFRTYNAVVVDTFTVNERLDGGSISDFQSYYTGISVVNVEEKTTSYYGLTQDDGLTYNMGSNPFLQYGTDSIKEVIRTAILDSFAIAKFVPAKFDLHALPVYDLMDVIQISGGIAGEGVISKSCILKYSWTYGQSYEFECVGSNPLLTSAKSKVDKDISGLLSSVSDKEINYYTYTNGKDLLIKLKKQILEIDFASTNDATVEFETAILLEAKGIVETATNYKKYNRTVVTVFYELNGEEDTIHVPVESYADGRHVLILYRPVSIAGNTDNILKVYLKADLGEITIAKGSIMAMVSGKGLAAYISTWDGKINVDEEAFPAISLLKTTSSILPSRFTEVLNKHAAVPTKESFAETMHAISLLDASKSLDIPAFNETVVFGVDNQLLNYLNAASCTYDTTKISIVTFMFLANQTATLTSYKFGGYVGIASISSIAAVSSANVLFCISKQSTPNVWKYFDVNSSTWIVAASETVGNTSAELNAIIDFADVYDYKGFYIRAYLPASGDFVASIQVNFGR